MTDIKEQSEIGIWLQSQIDYHTKENGELIRVDDYSGGLIIHFKNHKSLRLAFIDNPASKYDIKETEVSPGVYVMDVTPRIYTVDEFRNGECICEYERGQHIKLWKLIGKRLNTPSTDYKYWWIINDALKYSDNTPLNHLPIQHISKFKL